MRADQRRDKDKIRRDCITAEIDDLSSSITFGRLRNGKREVHLTWSEPKRPNEPKFQFVFTDATVLRFTARKILLALRALETKAPRYPE